MARDYTYNELMEMQDKAISRAKNMQEQARKTIEKQGFFGSDSGYDPMANKTSPLEKSPDFLSERGRKPFNLSGFFDKDRAVILPLLILLSKENADKTLLMALIYIMS